MLRLILISCLTLLVLTPHTGLAITPWSILINTNNVISVTNVTYGAIGDGIFTNTTAFQNAINAAAAGGITNGLRGGMVRVPAGVFLCGPLTMKSNVRLDLDSGAIIRLLPRGSWPGSPYTGTVSPLLDGSSLTNIAVTGLGMFDGQGSPWWPDYKTINRPLILSLQPCSTVLLQDFTSSNPPVAHIALKGVGGNISIIGVKLLAPSSDDPVNPSHNTDGVDLAETNALFQDCFISTGDDNIAMGSSGSVTCDMLVTNCFFGEGHGLSIGSYTSGGVSNLIVVDCTFSNTGNGIKIKSSRDRGGVVQNLSYYNITMTNVDWPIQFYSYYEWGLGTLTGLTPEFVANTAYTSTNPVPYSPPIYRSITISNVTANILNGRPPLLICGLPDYPIANIVFKSLKLTSSSTYESAIYNATNIQFSDCTLTAPSGVKSLQLWNAGVTFTNSLLSTNLLVLDGLTTNGVGNTLGFCNAQATVADTNAIAGGGLTLANSTFTVSNNFALTAITPLSYVVGTNSAILAVKGNLALGGTANIQAGLGFAAGIYPLITYSGTLSGAGLILGIVPANYNCSISSSTPGVVNLVVSNAITINLASSSSNGVVKLAWSAVATATNYTISRATNSGGTYATLATLSATNYTDINVVSGTTYYYIVSALTPGGVISSVEVTVTAAGSINAWSPPWQTQDIGTVGLTGNASYSNGMFTVTGAGADIQGTADAFRFAYLSISGDCTITARVVTQQNIDPWSKAGVMMRETLVAGAANAFVGITPGNGMTWQNRSATGGSTSYNNTTGLSVPYWVRMVRSGNIFTGYRSADGITWTQQGTATITMASTIYIGLAVTSHNAASLCTATFDNVTIPPQWPVQLSPSVAGVTNQIVIAGNNTTLNAIVSGYPVPTLQWRSNAVVLVSQTNVLLALNNVSYAQNGTVYSLVSSNAIGVVTNSMTLTVIVTPNIIGLNNQAATIGNTVSIPAIVTGVPTPSLRWQFNGYNLLDGATGNGSTISGSTSSTLTINNAQATDSGMYLLVASNAAGIVTNAMTLTVSAGNVAPFMTGPTDQTVVQTSNTTFTASVSGLPVPTLQWRVNGANISGATNSSLTISNIQYSQNTFVYSLVASNLAGVITNSANLFVLVPPAISAQPNNLVVTNTKAATFSVAASGVPTPSYRWYFNSNFISGATTSNYVIAAATPANLGNYFVIVSNSIGAVTSAVVTLTVNSTMAAVSLTPSNGAASVCYDTPLYVTFNQTPFLRTAGTIKIYNANNPASPVDIIDLSLCVTNDATYAANVQTYTIGGDSFYAFPVIITGNTAAIYPHQGLLTSNQTYFVTLDNGTFTDGAGAYFAGIAASNLWRFTTKPTGPTNSTNLIVAADYSGDFATVQGAVNFVPSGSTTPRLINIRDGLYKEIIDVNSRHNLSLRGQSRNGTIVGYPNNNLVNGGAPWRASFIINGNDCALQSLTLTNMTPKGGSQAEAVDVEATRAIFYNINLCSYQDTFLSHNSGQLIYFQECLVQGDTDFNWGYGSVYYTNCEIRAMSSGAYVTQPRSPLGSNGFAFVDCKVTKGYSGSSTFNLGRTIGNPSSTSQVLFMRCLMDDTVSGYNSDAGANMADYACSNLTATAAKTLLYSTHLTAGSSWVIAAQSAASWLYGWQPQLAPNILTNPVSQIISNGQSVVFAVSATGIPSPNYQWRKNGINLVGQVDAALTIPNAQATDAGNYSVMVTNSSGSVISSNATLNVTAAVNTTPTNLVYTISSSNLTFFWPVDRIGWRLESQTNNLTTGLGTNWFTVSGSSASNQFTVPINSTAGSFFFRLAYP